MTACASPLKITLPATVTVIGIAARNGHPISFWRFTRYGVLVAAVTLVIAWAYWALRYVVLA